MLTDKEIAALRLRFPMLRGKTYLDSHSRGAIMDATSEFTGGYKELRAEFARFIHAEPHQIALLSSVIAATKLAQDKGALVLVDGSHDCGTRPVDVKLMDVDFYIADASRYLLGPPGLAFLYSKRPPDNVETLALDDQTISAARQGLTFLEGIGMQNIASQIAQLTRNFMQGLRALCIASPTRTNAGPLVVVSAADPAALVSRMAERGVVVSVGEGGALFSFHVYNDFTDINTALGVLQANLKLLEVSS